VRAPDAMKGRLLHEACLTLALAYNYLLGRWLVHAANGYWPSMRFQRLQPGWLADPGAWLEGLAVLRDWTAVHGGPAPYGAGHLPGVSGR
jgi:hypothetical protein